ncbi:helix-turn-helix domain-containing protein [Chryseobacterium culicis]|uniref:helix-turn-helix domain-containing protein n=1 Tax=Chryseobacterium culicis TaxID=680127 RepID=UPI001D0BEDD3|nr:helix-turn-helix domain-containing protein [Chryseobacterium culicis]
MKPNYKSIYSDILKKQYPHKISECEILLKKKILSVVDIIKLNEMIFGKSQNHNYDPNQKYRSYSKADILMILDYQKHNKLNNIQLARHFRLSRNTITKWKRIFL